MLGTRIALGTRQIHVPGEEWRQIYIYFLLFFKYFFRYTLDTRTRGGVEADDFELVGESETVLRLARLYWVHVRYTLGTHIRSTFGTDSLGMFALRETFRYRLGTR